MTPLCKRSGPLTVLACLVMTGCATTETESPSQTHDNLDAVTWLQASTEYAATTTSLYSAATTALREIAAAGDPSSMAVVLDIDETVLDNSRYQAQLIVDDAVYDGATWDEWIERGSATAVPGVVDFIRASQAMGVHVAFITNRSCRERDGLDDVCPQKEETLENLEDVDIDTRNTTLYIRREQPPEACVADLTEGEKDSGSWSSDKTSRRLCVERDRQIVMLFGDQLGDFTAEPEDMSETSARELAASFRDNWGRTWFMLPNPTYGGWKANSTDEKRSALRTVN